MAPSAEEIDRQTRKREQIDENRDVLEHRPAWNGVRYGKIAAVAVGIVAVAGAGLLIYRSMNRSKRSEQLRAMVIEALKDLPDTLHDLPDEVLARLKKPLPSIKVVVNAEEPEEPGTLERIVRRVAPGVVGTASSAVIERFTRTSDSGAGSALHGSGVRLPE
ncbi:MAG TPA: hypothetical protein VNU27_11490 [Candidatus Acidoferrum sp.]|jgi:hypothetical protein|nr:hypothetical protein [Candidatus Acidoferrum sp.]